MCNKYYKYNSAINRLILRGGVENVFVCRHCAARIADCIVEFWMLQIRRFSGNLLHPFVFDTCM